MTKQPPKILVVDDEPDLCEILKFNLEASGNVVMTAHSAEEALFVIAQHGYPDLLLLDVMMVGMSGFEFAERLRDNHVNVPVIFLTAKDREDDALTGFALGADDYISKPFSLREVQARVNAVLRRTIEHIKTDIDAIYHGIILKQTSKRVYVDGREVAFTKTEYELLLLFVRHPGTVFSRQQLLKEVWPEGVYVSDRTVDVNITRIRKKIVPYDSCLVTRQGYGYILEV
jgi:DNA-binding response OmpR family regulator